MSSIYDNNSFYFADCLADFFSICFDVLWYSPHCWRVQRHGCVIGTEKQVSINYPPGILHLSCRHVVEVHDSEVECSIMTFFPPLGHLTRWRTTRLSTCSTTEAGCSSVARTKKLPQPQTNRPCLPILCGYASWSICTETGLFLPTCHLVFSVHR